VKLDKEELTGS